MNLMESGEMYLETIWILSQKHPRVRSVDISDEMGFSKPSVSRAVGLLKKGGFITVEEGGGIQLTDTGREVAMKIYERHNVLSRLLITLGVDPEVASEDACKMEHAISDQSITAIKNFISQNEK